MRTNICNFKIKYLILQWTMMFPCFEATRKVYRENNPMSPVLPQIVQDFFRCLTLLYFLLHC